MAVNPPLNPILMLLEGNGSLAGRDRAGAFSATGSGALRYAAAPGARVNLCANPSFETGLTGWSVSGGLTMTQTADPVYGAQAARVTGDTTSANLFQHSAAGRMRVTPGATYTLSVNVKSPASLSVTLAVVWTLEDGSGATAAAAPASSTTPISARFSAQFTAPSDKSVAYVRFYVGNAVAADMTFDGVVFEAGSLVTPAYFDGSTGGVWLNPITGMLGTPHASPSVSRAQFWVEEATTNLMANPSCEVSTGVHSVTSGLTLSRSTDRAYIGAASFQVDHDGGNTKRLVMTTLSGLGFTGSARPYTSSFYICGTGTVDCYTTIAYTDATFDSSAFSSPVVLTGAWQRMFAPLLTANAAKTIQYILISIRLSGAQAAGTFYVDAAQVEEKAYATSYCDGSLGTGYTWAGTAHASASTRAQGYITVPVASHLSTIEGSVVFRSKMKDNGVTYAFMSVGGFGTNDWLSPQVGFATTNQFNMGSKVAAATTRFTTVSSPAFPDDASAIGYGGWASATVEAALNSGSVASISRVETPSGVTGTLINFGNGGGATGTNGQAGPVAIYDEPLSAARRTMVNAAIDSNGAIDLWTLFEEWDAVLSPVDLLDLEAIEATVGVVAEFAPLDLFELNAGAVSVGVTAELEPLDFGLDYEDIRGVSVIPLPAAVGWDDASSPLVTWSPD